MKKSIVAAIILMALSPALALAQEPGSLTPWKTTGAFGSPVRDGTPLPRNLEEDLPEFSTPGRGTGLGFMQEEIAPHLRFSLSLYARIDVPGGTSVDSFDNVTYADIFDIGIGLNVEASLMSWVTPHWGLGGYVSIGWDRFFGASNVDMGSGEFFSFDDQDMVTIIVGGKVLQKIAPFWYWEGRMGVGLVHYGSLGFTDVTGHIADPGLQFFKPVSHGLFDLGGRLGVGSSRATFDFGIDFRFMGGESPGRDVTSAIDPRLFFVFAIDAGVSLRF